MAITEADYDVVIGLDVGKGAHHAAAIDRTESKILDRPFPNDEKALRALFADLQDRGRLLLVVDLAASIGARPVAVAHDSGIDVAYLPGLSMRRFADLRPGESKTDARDAFIIARSARIMPGALKKVELSDETIAELSVLCGFDDDLVQQTTTAKNRLRGMINYIHPALERVLGPKLENLAILDLLASYPSPSALKRLGRARTASRLQRLSPRKGSSWSEDIHDALAEQTVTIAGTDGAAVVISSLAALLTGLLHAMQSAEERILNLVNAHPLHAILSSIPSVGLKTEARILTEVVSREFPSAGYLASFAGLAPATWRSGSSINSTRAPRRGNKILKRLFYGFTIGK